MDTSLEKIVTEAKYEGSVVGKMLKLATDGVINNEEQFNVAADHLKEVKGFLKRIEAKYKDWTKGINESLRQIRADYNPAKAAGERAERIWKDKILVYREKEKRIREQQEAKLREDAEKERVKLETAAVKLEAKGKPEQAQVKRDLADATPTPVIAPPAKIAGLSFSTEYGYEITDLENLPRWVMIPDHTKLQGLAESTKGSMEIQGVRWTSKQVAASGSK